MSVQARVVVLVACVGPEVRVVWLALSEVVIDDRSEKWQHCHHDGKAHRPHSDKHAIHSKKSIAPAGERDALEFVTGLDSEDYVNGAFQSGLTPIRLRHSGI